MSDIPLSTSAMSIDSNPARVLGMRLPVRVDWRVTRGLLQDRGSWECHLDGTPFHGRYPDAAVPLSGVILDVKCETSANIWTVTCVFELITGSDYLSDPADGSHKHARVQIQLSEAEFYPHNSLFTAVYCISSNAWQCFLFTIILS